MDKAISKNNLNNALMLFKTNSDKNYNDKINKLENTVTKIDLRSTIGAELDYGCFKCSTDMTISATTPLVLDKVISGNMKIINGGIHLQKYKTYLINISVWNIPYAYGIYLYDVDKKVNLLTSVCGTTSFQFTPIEDCNVTIATGTNLTYSATWSFGIIVNEVGRTIILDPLDTKENHIIEYGYYNKMSGGNLSVLANENIIKYFTKVNGNLAINTDYSITLKKDKNYKIDFSLCNMGNSTVCYLADSNNVIYAKSYNGINDSWSDSFLNTIITPTEDINIKLYFTTAKTIDNSFSSLTIYEIAQPIVTEYTQYNEISNPLTNSDISQESPVGSIISYIGTTPPQHYLICDGSIHNITDYKELADFIKNIYGSYNYFGGDGLTTFAIPNMSDKFVYSDIDKLPTMISNTSPSGTAFCDSIWDSGYPAWKAFDKSFNQGWDSANTAFPHHIGYQFPTATIINRYGVASRTLDGNDVSVNAKSWNFQASNDGTNWTTIDIQNNIKYTEKSQTYWFNCYNNDSYLYYRLLITSNNGFNGTNCALGEFYLYYRQIKSVMMIKYESTYYAVNQYGGFDSKVLFEGKINTTGNFALSDDITNYDYIIVSGAWYSGNGGKSTLLINRKDIVYSSNNNYILIYPGSDTWSACKLYFYFNSTASIFVDSGTTYINITKIEGIKGQLPTFYREVYFNGFN
jgi:hypothetical protein